MPGADKKNATKAKILQYIINNQDTSKVELSKRLNISMPTVLSNVNDLIERGIVLETGEHASTGGRKAKSIAINPGYRYAVGLVITANHLGLVLVNMRNEIEKAERVRLKFSQDMSYCTEVKKLTNEFLEDVKEPERILGIGISIPGILNLKEQLIVKSHALGLENYSLSFLEQTFSVPVFFENDANAAMLAEDLNTYKNAIYLSLNSTLGGAFCIEGKLVTGQNQKAGEFGHMILVPGGRKCYCGKTGCADAYCAASALTGETFDNVQQFLNQMEQGDSKLQEQWDAYLDKLAILITNLRMAYDLDVILGGEVGGYLENYMLPLGEKVMYYNGFDRDVRYISTCSYKKEASAVGVAKHFLTEFIKTL